MKVAEPIHVVSGDGLKPAQVTLYEKIHITFNYPIAKEVVFAFEHKGGFTMKDFIASVRKGYRTIFKEAEKYGVWGHDIGDLYVEGIEEPTPGMFTLLMGS